MLKLIPFLFVLFSCAHHVKQPDEPKTLVFKFWQGRSGDEITLHPVYASLPLESRKTTDGTEVRSFTVSSNTRSDLTCFGTAGCLGSSTSSQCSFVFYLKNNKIVDMNSVGPCNVFSTSLRPYENGGPIITGEEKEYIKRTFASEGVRSCKVSNDCTNGQSCQANQCKSLGIWGRIFNP